MSLDTPAPPGSVPVETTFHHSILPDWSHAARPLLLRAVGPPHTPTTANEETGNERETARQRCRSALELHAPCRLQASTPRMLRGRQARDHLRSNGRAVSGQLEALLEESSQRLKSYYSARSVANGLCRRTSRLARTPITATKAAVRNTPPTCSPAKTRHGISRA